MIPVDRKIKDGPPAYRTTATATKSRFIRRLHWTIQFVIPLGELEELSNLVEEAIGRASAKNRAALAREQKRLKALKQEKDSLLTGQLSKETIERRLAELSSWGTRRIQKKRITQEKMPHRKPSLQFYSSDPFLNRRCVSTTQRRAIR